VVARSLSLKFLDVIRKVEYFMEALESPSETQPRRFRPVLPGRLTIAALLAIVASIGVFLTPLREEPVNLEEGIAKSLTAAKWDAWEWLTHPLELNPAGSVTRTTAAIADMCVVPKSGRVWICGEGGLTAFSDNRGETWRQESLPDEDRLTPVEQSNGGKVGGARKLPNLTAIHFIDNEHGLVVGFGGAAFRYGAKPEPHWEAIQHPVSKEAV
jgi:hypothetical protein